MTPFSKVATRSVLGAARVVLTVALCAPTLATAVARPIVPAMTATPVAASTPIPALGTVETTVGAGNASLTPDRFAIAVDRPYRFTARVRVPKGTDSVLMRFKVLNPSGRLMIQKTSIQSRIETGQATAVFERDTDDLGLTPGNYPVRLEVQVVDGGVVTDEALDSELLVYDPKGRAVPVVLAVRVSGQPLSDPQGRFVADPAQYTRARDDVRTLALRVIGSPDARMTLAASPFMLEEWKRISEGYVLAGPEGEASVAADSAVPLAYAETLDRLRDAIRTGRLELTLTGYTDPDLSLLSRQGMASDVAVQYAQGLSAIYASVESTPTTGTVVAGGCIPPDTLEDVIGAGVEYVVVDADCTRSGSSKATPGKYTVKEMPLVALVTDDQASRAVAETDPESLVHRIFERRQAGSVAPVVITAQVGPGHLTAESVTSAAALLEAQPWVRIALGRDVAAGRPRRTVVLKEGSGGAQAPAGYWDAVRDGRRWADALAGALPDSPAAVTAARDSLVAQCSAWAGSDGEWALADRGQAFANHSVRLARGVFEPITLEPKPVTLAGSSGEVPITVSNDGDLTMSLVLKCEPSRSLRVAGEQARTIQVLPKDNFIEIPVEIQNAISGRLTVKLVSGDTVIDEQTVTVTASYLDRLVMIVAVIAVLGVMLAFVIRRVRAVEKDEDDTPRPES